LPGLRRLPPDPSLLAAPPPAERAAARPRPEEGIDGKGQTIVIVDSYGSPTIGHDLGCSTAAFGLPAPPSLRDPAGREGPGLPSDSQTGRAGPGETTSTSSTPTRWPPVPTSCSSRRPTSENEGTTGFPQIVTAEKYVINHHLGGVISQSFSATEQTFPSRPLPD
jgi:hypothetical protein